ncbi:MAG: hypothetical protein MRERC_2c003 [Mycoplasmataceae bacterium RC_NB112A]|nr:MAG: hypothetical protein MRERC_6c098 [Mycoplasmataceae bacterium RC_NB112A]KLL02133.1 MAG: hypothetical protein MRERC_4c092 [Mycoplasmataceae bacterium RC_NB112A]KLL02175.1 MAG: hypothetical protein MRERC_4c150 [Mycoplasmataceae bacterium RC_NB112A]KLL02295.1 MAG: hypothetical protein MRERC_2c003 [Mycoplasmataceae bacterium RC_NB112A]
MKILKTKLSSQKEASKDIVDKTKDIIKKIELPPKK